jgi:arylsulfatase A-like enzyme
MHCWATDKDDPTDDPVFGRVGKQKIENTGPLTTKRMETVNDEFTDAALAFIDKAHKEGKPFFVWANSTRMHIFTHLKPQSIGKTGLGTYPDGMVEHDGDVKRLLDKLDELGIADNTLVMYSTDNGPEEFSWPDGGTSPFRGEKDTNWDAGWRVPALLRWPGSSNQARSPMRSAPTKTCCQRCSRLPACRTSRSSCSRATRRATRRSRSTSMATTCCRISRAKSPNRREKRSCTGATTEN